MTIRTRITVVAALAISLAVVAAAIVIHLAEMADLRRQVDIDLALRASEIGTQLATGGQAVAALHGRFGSPITYAQLVSSDAVATPLEPGSPTLPIDASTLAVARGEQARAHGFVTVQDVHLRVLTVDVTGDRALQVARPVAELELHALHMGAILLAVVAAGVVVSILLGRVVAQASLAPVVRLTRLAEQVAETGDTSARIDVAGGPELERLARAMNLMLAALDESLARQRRLVSDASHELQTPLTSLRMDAEVLDGTALLAPGDADLVRDIVQQVDELSQMVANVVELGREGIEPARRRPVDLDHEVARAIRWARRMHPSVDFVAVSDEVVVDADPDDVVRLLHNLLDNAARWTSDGFVSVELTSSRLVVRDHGPGIAPVDAPHLFERFYRAEAARGTRGAGLGLAIVDTAVRRQGWQVTASNHPDGGAQFIVDLTADDGHSAGQVERRRGLGGIARRTCERLVRRVGSVGG